MSNFLREELNLSLQEAGNCGWANSHGLAEIFTALENIKVEILNPLERDYSVIKEKIQLARHHFKKNTYVFKVKYLSKYLDFHAKHLNNDRVKPNSILIAVCLGKLIKEKNELELI